MSNTNYGQAIAHLEAAVEALRADTDLSRGDARAFHAALDARDALRKGNTEQAVSYIDDTASAMREEVDFGKGSTRAFHAILDARNAALDARNAL